MNTDSMITLYRVCTQRDKENSYVLNSSNHYALTNEQALQEIVSHELNARTGRGVFYSFTYDLELARGYKVRNPKNTEICYINIDLENMITGVLGIYPIYSRDYVMSLMCSAPKVLSEGRVLDPATGRGHSLLGILNTSQHTVCGWAHSMREIVLQCEELELKVLDDNSRVFDRDTQVMDSIIRRHLHPVVTEESMERLRSIITRSFVDSGCKRLFLIDKITKNEWAKVA